MIKAVPTTELLFFFNQSLKQGAFSCILKGMLVTCLGMLNMLASSIFHPNAADLLFSAFNTFSRKFK